MPFLGSPPRVRGKGSCGSVSPLTARITPACAGKSNVRLAVDGFSEDHPRVCGEKHPQFGTLCFTMGSPPRVRGKELDFLPGFFGDRITPACAGKSAKAVTIEAIQKDHPRVCGEKTEIPVAARQALGSPPRVRGKAPLLRSG